MSVTKSGCNRNSFRAGLCLTAAMTLFLAP